MNINSISYNSSLPNTSFNARINWKSGEYNVTEKFIGTNNSCRKVADAFDKALNGINDSAEYSIRYLSNPELYSRIEKCPAAIFKNDKPITDEFVGYSEHRHLNGLFLQKLFFMYPHELLDTALETGFLERITYAANNSEYKAY